MKKLNTVLTIVLLIIIASCNNNPETKAVKEEVEETKGNASQNIESKDYTIINMESKVNWSAQGVGHGHKGTVSIISGKFSIENTKISKGKISINMTSIEISDIKDPGENKDLTDHLIGDDFFNVSEFPVASLEIIDGSDMNNVKAEMTIKGVTQEILFPISTSVIDGKVVLNSKLTIDRTKFGITYSSGNFFKDLGDHLIEDDIVLNVTLVAK